MKAARCMMLSVAALALSACASMPRSEIADETSVDAYNSRYNLRYVAEVERRSAKLGVTVLWVNPPLAPRNSQQLNR